MSAMVNGESWLPNKMHGVILTHDWKKIHRNVTSGYPFVVVSGIIFIFIFFAFKIFSEFSTMNMYHCIIFLKLMLSDLVISVLALYSKEISKSVNKAFVHRDICYRIIIVSTENHCHSVGKLTTLNI